MTGKQRPNQRPLPGQKPPDNRAAATEATRPTPVQAPASTAQPWQAGAPTPYPLAGQFTLSPPGMLPVMAQQTQQTLQIWQGQFPPPDAVERYERVLPGAFNRILSIVECTANARIMENKRAQDFARIDMRRGHWLGFATAIIGMGCALVAAALHYPWVAGALVGIPVMSIGIALVQSAKGPSAKDILKAGTSRIPAATQGNAPSRPPQDGANGQP